jgi:hypothetical protein
MCFTLSQPEKSHVRPDEEGEEEKKNETKMMCTPLKICFK